MYCVVAAMVRINTKEEEKHSAIGFGRFEAFERKRKRSDSVLRQKPLHQQKCEHQLSRLSILIQI